MDAKNSYLALMESLKGNSSNIKESEERKVEFNDQYKQNHPAQTELISHIQSYISSNIFDMRENMTIGRSIYI